MAPRDNFESYEATEAQDLTRLLRAVRPPERAVQVPPPVDLTIRAAIWQAPVRRQVSTLLSLARRDLIRVIRQALTDNPMLEAVTPAEDEDMPAGEAHAPHLTAAAADLADAAERYDSIWQACVPDSWDAHGLPAQSFEEPGARFTSEPAEAIVPDVIVIKRGHEYQVVLNDEGIPRLGLSQTYRRMLREGHLGQPEATHDLDDKLRAAVWLIRSLEQRCQTLDKVAKCLVTCQREFLDHGLAHLKPLALTEVAEALGLHASTVRLVITNKYLYTEQGLFELKYFFHSGLESSGGETMSSLTVKDRITKLVAAEDPAKPLTDQQLVEALAAEQVKIARRTVTRYRCELRLPPANRRKRSSDIESSGGETPSSLTVHETQQRLAADVRTHPQPVWLPGSRRSSLFCPACGMPRPEPWRGVPCRACGSVEEMEATRHQQRGSATRGAGPAAGASQLSPDEEQRMRQALFRRWQAEPPLRRDHEEAPGVPPGDEEPQRRPDDEAAESLHQWVEKIYSIDFSRLAADPEVHAAYRDLQTALAHPQWRPAVLLALRAFAQAAQVGATTSRPADAVEPVPRLQERPHVEALSSIHDLDHLLECAIERVMTLLDIENASIILLDEARDELYIAKIADEHRVGHEQRLRGVRFPATHGVAGWVVREGRSLIVPDVDHDPRVYRGFDVHAGTRTRYMLCVPLRTQGRIIGVLQGINKRQGPFTAEDVRRLEAFAHELARTLEQAHAIQGRYHGDVQQPIAEAERLAARVVPFNTLIGESPRMQEVFRLVERVQHTTATVLLTGERGTGKNLIARLLHDQGPRAQGPFIVVNCAALPETRLEAELFGDERGAGSGATQRQLGCLELAAGGTLYLDEIAEMSIVLQGKLLRVLQEKKFTRVGGTETLPIDARIVAATSQDLERLVGEGRFRRDLYDRLNVYPIALPPLRERQEDLRALTL